jgi:hypothetical protein
MKDKKATKKWAVVLGRFQPLHKEHNKIFEKAFDDGCDAICIMVGEQEGNGKDPLHYMHRANALNQHLNEWFYETAIVPMYNFGSDPEWAYDVYTRILETIPARDTFVIYIATKAGDLDAEGYHYATALRNTVGAERMVFCPVTDDSINATAIRENYDENCWMVNDANIHFLMQTNHFGKPPEEKFLFFNDWMKVKVTSFAGGRNGYMYSSRRNRDSIGFVIKYKDQFGFIIEQKPPLGMRRCASAFGGSFDSIKDNPYRILKNEVLEEAGFTEDQILEIKFKGCYMATTQSDEVVHLYLVEVDSPHFDPQTTDPGEMKNQCIWTLKGEARYVDDWKAQMILRDE